MFAMVLTDLTELPEDKPLLLSRSLNVALPDRGQVLSLRISTHIRVSLR
jgi:hypothetical protein